MTNRGRTWMVAVWFVGTLAVVSGAQEKAPEPIVALVGATLIDGTGAPPFANTTVLIQGERIKAVGSATAIAVPPGARTIDVTGEWILPGLIDCHIRTPRVRDELQELADPDSLATPRGVHEGCERVTVT